MSVYLEKKLAKRAKAMAIGIQFKATERVDFFSSYFSKKNIYGPYLAKNGMKYIV